MFEAHKNEYKEVLRKRVLSKRDETLGFMTDFQRSSFMGFNEKGADEISKITTIE